MVNKAIQYAERGSAELHYLQKMISAGAFGIEPPQNYAALLADIKRWGEVGMIPALNARRNPNRLALIDDEADVNHAATLSTCSLYLIRFVHTSGVARLLVNSLPHATPS